MSSGVTGASGYVKTTLVFTTYDEKVANEVIEHIKSRYKVLECSRSEVIKELYYVAVEGEAPEIADDIKHEVIWVKADVLRFE